MFVIAQVQQRIIGADFLCEFALFVDLKNNCLLDLTTLATVQTGVMVQGAPQRSFINNRCEFLDSWSAFPTCTAPQIRQTCHSHNVQHHVEARGPAVFAEARRFSPTFFMAAKAEFNTLLQLEQLCVTIAHCAEEEWLVVSMRRLPCTQQCHHP